MRCLRDVRGNKKRVKKDLKAVELRGKGKGK